VRAPRWYTFGTPIEHLAAAAARGFAMHGLIKFYDDVAAWGVIQGEDGRLYSVRGGQLGAPPPRIGDRVAFEPEPAAGGPRAADVRRLRSLEPTARNKS